MEPIAVDIRPMERRHLDEVYAIEVSSYPHPWPYSSFEQEITVNAHARYYVALAAAEKVVGYIGLWRVLDEGHITNIAASYGYRRRKVGEQMLIHTLEECLRHGVRTIFLEVRRYNLAAQRLYTRYGFTPVRVRDRYYQDNDEDAIELRIPDMMTPEFAVRFRDGRNRLLESLVGAPRR